MRLNLGAGGRRDPGWIHVDREFGPVTVAQSGRIVRLDIAKDAWPWEPSTVDGIAMHHVLDLLAAADVPGVLARCHRVLQVGAVLRVSLADLTAGIDAALRGDEKWFAEPKYADADWPVDLEATLGSFITQGGARRQFIDRGVLRGLLKDAGFEAPVPVAYDETIGSASMCDLDSRERESFFMEARRT